MPSTSLGPRWVLRSLLALAVVGSLAVGAGLTLAYEPPEIQTGAVESPANGTTYVAVQGFHFRGTGATKKPARLVAIGPRGQPKWIYNGSKHGASWFYNVDPLPNGNLLVVNTAPGKTMVYELDPQTRERLWQENFSIEDTHDVDLINGDQLLVANMREYDDGTSNDRIFIYDRSEDRIVWEWYFKNHYPRSTDGGMTEDWTHVNDVDKIGPGEFLVSPRNFDQVIVVNRSTKNITMRLGSDENHEILYEQHDPQYLESENGTPTVLVADSENDRVVEYGCIERTGGGQCEWTRVWSVGTDQLSWPRDADRLPNGNTLIVDTLNHRVIEVTPTGEIVWEVYTPWAPFDAERAVYGNEAGGPTMLDLNVSGSYRLSGSAGETPGTGDGTTFPGWLSATFAGTPLESTATDVAETWEGVSQWVKPVWMAPWTLVCLAAALVVVVCWAVGEVVYQRRRLADGVRRGVRQML
jgi:hypothetical protein